MQLARRIPFYCSSFQVLALVIHVPQVYNIFSESEDDENTMFNVSYCTCALIRVFRKDIRDLYEYKLQKICWLMVRCIGLLVSYLYSLFILRIPLYSCPIITKGTDTPMKLTIPWSISGYVDLHRATPLRISD